MPLDEYGYTITATEAKKRAKLKKQAEDWNKRYPVGTKVKVTTDGHGDIETTTRGEAWVLGHHSVVINFDAPLGPYRIERVAVLEEDFV